LISQDQHATRVILSLSGTSQSQKSSLYDRVSTHLNARGLTTTVGGPWAVFNDVNHTVSKDIARAEAISMPIVFILCLFIFGSVVSALMPSLVGSVAVFGAFTFVRFTTMVTDVSVFAINVITLLGMGLAIDYALFVVSRFREELAKEPGTDREHVNSAIAATMATAGRTVLFSGLIVAASLTSLLIFPQNFLRSMGYGGVAALDVTPPNSRAPKSAATRLDALAGSTRSSTLPHLADRNGAARAIRATTMTSRQATGRRITLCAREAHAPDSTETPDFASEPRRQGIAPPSIRGPRTVSSAGRTVRAGAMATSTAPISWFRGSAKASSALMSAGSARSQACSPPR
jgi:MMPL family